MGCKQSRQVRVLPIGELNAANKHKLKKCTSENDPIEHDIDDKAKRHRRKRGKSGKNRGSTDSLDGALTPDSDRGGSAGSKKSQDSGLGDLGECNQGFITEKSDPNKVKEIEEGFKERDDLDLGITGIALPTRNSAKDKARLEEAMILQKLREEGLISRPNAQASGGVSFEIVENSTSRALPALPPVRLAKLEKRRKKKRQLTEEDIREKLQRAEARRKKKEQARLDKIKDLDKADQTAALESFADYKKKREIQVTQKMDSVTDNRERRLNEIKEKMKERERRAEEVRRRKQLNAEMSESQEQIATNGEDINQEEPPKKAEETIQE